MIIINVVVVMTSIIFHIAIITGLTDTCLLMIFGMIVIMTFHNNHSLHLLFSFVLLKFILDWTSRVARDNSLPQSNGSFLHLRRPSCSSGILEAFLLEFRYACLLSGWDDGNIDMIDDNVITSTHLLLVWVFSYYSCCSCCCCSQYNFRDNWKSVFKSCSLQYEKEGRKL